MKELKLEELTVEQKIGQLLVVRGFVDEDDKKFVFEMLEKKAVGGVQVKYFPGCEKLIAEINEKAGYPVLICADMEHGFPGSSNKIGAQMTLASTDSVEMAYEFARMAAIEEKKAGYNVTWGPVVDLGTAIRRFSDDPEICAKFGTALVRGYQEEGMVCTAKHFPGKSRKGASPDKHIDTHISKGVPSDATVEQLMERDLVPYIDAIKNADLSGVMLGHNEFENIDKGVPASMSPKIIGMLRDIGFKGVIMTDSMAMMIIVRRFGNEECVWRPIAAGADMVLPNYRLSYKESYDYLMKAYNEGKFSEERLNDAVRHVLEAQKKTMKKASSTELNERQKQLCDEIAKKGIAAIVKKGTEVKLAENTKKLFVIMHENLYPGIEDKSMELAVEKWYFREEAEKKRDIILKEFPDAEVFLINEFPHQFETEAMCNAMAKADEVIFFTFCRTSSYLASNSLSVRIEYVISESTDKISTVVHMGNPREIRKFKGIKRILFALPEGNSEKYIVDALKGKFVPTGKLPVKGIEEMLFDN